MEISVDVDISGDTVVVVEVVLEGHNDLKNRNEAQLFGLKDVIKKMAISRLTMAEWWFILT